MSDVALDTEGDLLLDDGDFPFVEDDDALVQRLRISLSLFRGEYWLDVSKGVPYFDQVLLKGASSSAVSAVFQDAILSTEGMRSLDSLDLSLSQRLLTVRFAVNGGESIVVASPI